MFFKNSQCFIYKVETVNLLANKRRIVNFNAYCFRARFWTKITTVVDCFELFIDRPSNLTARALTWSYYKNHNIVKYLIGITPQGTISFISNGWGGGTSDQHITENSDFLKNLEYGDTVMADRGFNIAETLGTRGARLEIPSFTKGKSQLSAIEVEKTRVLQMSTYMLNVSLEF